MSSCPLLAPVTFQPKEPSCLQSWITPTAPRFISSSPRRTSSTPGRALLCSATTGEAPHAATTASRWLQVDWWPWHQRSSRQVQETFHCSCNCAHIKSNVQSVSKDCGPWGYVTLLIYLPCRGSRPAPALSPSGWPTAPSCWTSSSTTKTSVWSHVKVSWTCPTWCTKPTGADEKTRPWRLTDYNSK